MKHIFLIIAVAVTFSQGVSALTSAELIKAFPFIKREFPRGDLDKLIFIFEGVTAEEDVRELVKALKKVPKKERVDVAEKALRIRSFKEPSKFMNPTTALKNYISFLENFSRNEREEIVDCAETLTRKGTYITSSIFKALKEVPAGQREEVAVSASILVPVKSDSYRVSDILSEVAKVSTGQREEVARSVRLLIDGGLLSGYIESLLMNVEKNIPAGKREQVCQWAVPFIDESSINYMDVLEIFKAIAEGEEPEERRNNVKRVVDWFTKTLKDVNETHQKVEILKGVIKIPSSQLDNVFRHASYFIKKTTDLEKALKILNAFNELPSDQRGEITKHVKVLIDASTEKSDLESIKSLIKFILEVPRDQREEIAKHVKVLIDASTEKSDLESIKSLIKFILEVPRDQREEIAKHVKVLIDASTEKSDLESIKSLIKFILEVPREQRSRFVDVVAMIVLKPQLSRDLFASSDEHDYYSCVDVFRKLQQITDAELQSDIIDIFFVNPEHFSTYDDFVSHRWFPAENFFMAFTRELVREYARAQATLVEVYRISFRNIAERARAEVTQRVARRAPQAFHGGGAFEIHNASKVLVTFQEKRRPAYQVVQAILENLGIKKMTLRQCVGEMKALEKIDKAKVGTVISKAYYNPDSQDLNYTDMITPLLGYVWPYMKSRSVKTQRQWLQLAVDESATAYGASSMGVSCAKGIQERLVVTGFEVFFKDVDRRLVGISSLAKSLGSDALGLLNMGLNCLPREMCDSILQQEELTEGWVKNLFEEALKAYAQQNQAFKVEGMTFVDDFVSSPLKAKAMKFVDTYVDPDYGKLAELKTTAQRRLEALDEDLA